MEVMKCGYSQKNNEQSAIRGKCVCIETSTRMLERKYGWCTCTWDHMHALTYNTYRVRNLWSAAWIHLYSCEIIYENLKLILLNSVCMQSNIIWQESTWDSRNIVQENLCENGTRILTRPDSHRISNPATWTCKASMHLWCTPRKHTCTHM